MHMNTNVIAVLTLIIPVVVVYTAMEHGLAEWITTEIEVKIRETHDDPSLIHQIGSVRNISVSALLIYIQLTFKSRHEVLKEFSMQPCFQVAMLISQNIHYSLCMYFHYNSILMIFL